MSSGAAPAVPESRRLRPQGPEARALPALLPPPLGRPLGWPSRNTADLQGAQVLLSPVTGRGRRESPEQPPALRPRRGPWAPRGGLGVMGRRHEWPGPCEPSSRRQAQARPEGWRSALPAGG